MVLAILCWFGLDDPRVDRLAEHMIERQMQDGGRGTTPKSGRLNCGAVSFCCCTGCSGRIAPGKW